jgi:hypothetical protein
MLHPLNKWLQGALVALAAAVLAPAGYANNDDDPLAPASAAVAPARSSAKVKAECLACYTPAATCLFSSATADGRSIASPESQSMSEEGSAEAAKSPGGPRAIYSQHKVPVRPRDVVTVAGPGVVWVTPPDVVFFPKRKPAPLSCAQCMEECSVRCSYDVDYFSVNGGCLGCVCCNTIGVVRGLVRCASMDRECVECMPELSAICERSWQGCYHCTAGRLTDTCHSLGAKTFMR